MSLMMRRRMMMQVQSSIGDLPSEYRRISYLESQGSQYIKTDILPTNTLKISTIVTMLEETNSVIWGSRSSGTYLSSKDQFYLNKAYGNYDSNIIFVFGMLSSANNATIYENTNVINTQYKLFSDAVNFIGGATQPLYIFALNNLGTASALASCKLYSLQILDGIETLASFVPCVRVADKKPGLYDIVTKEFYTNAGTGEFIWG